MRERCDRRGVNASELAREGNAPRLGSKPNHESVDRVFRTATPALAILALACPRPPSSVRSEWFRAGRRQLRPWAIRQRRRRRFFLSCNRRRCCCSDQMLRSFLGKKTKQMWLVATSEGHCEGPVRCFRRTRSMSSFVLDREFDAHSLHRASGGSHDSPARNGCRWSKAIQMIEVPTTSRVRARLSSNCLTRSTRTNVATWSNCRVKAHGAVTR